ncbi:hypothetical protein predicted by Glimmer/Critica [Lactiplantibacillus plantarum]|nr:hypothetical protein predicted by Glimmer/Critica [Lactiplantibacillus plantarum]
MFKRENQRLIGCIARASFTRLIETQKSTDGLT